MNIGLVTTKLHELLQAALGWNSGTGDRSCTFPNSDTAAKTATTSFPIGIGTRELTRLLKIVVCGTIRIAWFWWKKKGKVLEVGGRLRKVIRA